MRMSEVVNGYIRERGLDGPWFRGVVRAYWDVVMEMIGELTVNDGSCEERMRGRTGVRIDGLGTIGKNRAMMEAEDRALLSGDTAGGDKYRKRRSHYLKEKVESLKEMDKVNLDEKTYKEKWEN